MAALERAAWSSPLQASEDRVRRRLALGHVMFVAEAADGSLAASLCFIPTAEEPHDRARFPSSFAAFSALPRSEPVRSVYVYNLCVHPAFRALPTVRPLMLAGIRASRALGARWLVGDGRCSAYAGSQPGSPDKVKPDVVFRQAIDRWQSSGDKPPDETLTRDPLLRFYRRQLNCRFLHLMPDFLPADTSSGGHRVIFVTDLASPGLAP
jgi:hypothetical protein